MQLPKSLKMYMGQTAIWTGLCVATELVCRFVLHWGFPYNYPFVPRTSAFGDFRYFASKFFLFHSRAFYPFGEIFTYPAPTALVYKLFLPYTTLQQNYKTATLCFIAFIALTSLVMLGFFYRALVGRGLCRRSAALYCTGVYLLSFPLWFELHQGNVEVAVWIVVSIGIWAHWTSRTWLASICFGVAASMKMYPVILLGLLLARKQYRQLALAVLTACVVTLACLWLVCPDIAYSWHQTNAAIGSMHDAQMLRLYFVTSGFDHALWSLLKTSLPHLPPPAQLNHLLTIYLATAAIAGVAVFFLRIVKLPLVNQIVCLSIACLLLPPISYDYTLVHLYPPFALITFIALQQRDHPSRPLQAALALFAFLLSFQEEFIWHTWRLGGPLKAIALLALFILSATYPFALEPRKNSLPAPAAI